MNKKTYVTADDLVITFAREFSKDALTQIADAAETRAKILRETDLRPWKRRADVNNAIDDFEQLARYARRIVTLQIEID
jgi:hypothetical protein